MAAFSVAAFVLCFALAGTTNIAAGFADKKAYNKGYRALRKGDFQEAEKIFRELLGKDAHDVEARLGLSFTLLKQRSLQGAYDNAARVIMLNPLSARAHALLGAAILAAGEFRLSVEEFRTALALDENESLAVAGLAMVDFYENRMATGDCRFAQGRKHGSGRAGFRFQSGPGGGAQREVQRSRRRVRKIFDDRAED